MITTKNLHFNLAFAFSLLFLTGGAQSSTFSKYFAFTLNSQMSTSTFTNCHELRHQNGYLLTAEKYTNQNIRNTMLIRTDTSLNELWTTMLNFRLAAAPFDNIQFSDVGELLNGNYYLFGQAAVVGDPYYVIYVFDTTGTVIHYTAIHDTLNLSNLAVMTDLKISKDSSLIITLSEYEKFGFYRLDQNLNLISSAVYSNNLGVFGGRGSFLLADSTILFPGDSGGLILTKTNLNNSIIWTYRYPEVGKCFTMCQTATGSIYIGGAAYPPSGSAVSYVAKISATGQLIWYHTYLMANSLTMSAIWNMYRDGNNLMLYSDSVMFKIDTLGFPIGNGFTVNSDNYKVMKPCGGNDFMLAGPVYQSTPQAYRHTILRFDMNTVSGCLLPRAMVTTVASSQRLPAIPHALAHGIQSEIILYSDTTVQMDYDFFYGCPITGVGISEISEAINTFSVFPNPASDVMNIHYEPNDRNAVLTFTLTDISGRIVLSEQVNKGGENEFSFSVLNMAEGIYTISLYENGLAAGHKLFSVKH
ncbi:MAG: T9SS type A sorting domain-containing protein [Bacteroidia bacterium]